MRTRSRERKLENRWLDGGRRMRSYLWLSSLLPAYASDLQLSVGRCGSMSGFICGHESCLLQHKWRGWGFGWWPSEGENAGGWLAQFQGMR